MLEEARQMSPAVVVLLNVELVLNEQQQRHLKNEILLSRSAPVVVIATSHLPREKLLEEVG